MEYCVKHRNCYFNFVVAIHCTFFILERDEAFKCDVVGYYNALRLLNVSIWEIIFFKFSNREYGILCQT